MTAEIRQIPLVRCESKLRVNNSEFRCVLEPGHADRHASYVIPVGDPAGDYWRYQWHTLPRCVGATQ